MLNIALIPARSGSKRLPGKNIKLLNGKPLIAYSIEAGLASKEVNRLIVSTDSEEIAKISREYGAETPFLRPKDLAQDDTSAELVYFHLINWLKEKENYEFDRLVILRPTTPFKTSEMINKAMQILDTSPHLTSLRTVTRVEGVFHPYWMFKEENGLLISFIDSIDITQYYQSQLLPECYRINGVVDILKVDIILKNKNPYGDKIGFLKIDERHSIDVDSQFDFELCKFLMSRGKNK